MAADFVVAGELVAFVQFACCLYPVYAKKFRQSVYECVRLPRLLQPHVKHATCGQTLTRIGRRTRKEKIEKFEN